ncbi:MAG: DUF3014 domain-containing protein [Burkholderiales bacterium]|nr:DUF3014 domain-containing protein [Burkholderiales bacterium]
MASATHRPPLERNPSLRADPGDRPDLRRGSRAGRYALLLLALLAGAAAAWYWWQHQAAEPPPPAAPVTVREPAAPAPAAPTPPAAAVEHYPPPPPEPSPIRTGPDVLAALQQLLGPARVAAFLQTDDFVRRAVATLDNLGRDHAPPAAWPFKPTPGQFQVDAPSGDQASASAANAKRYDAWVTMAESVNPAAAAAVYRRMYPLLQQTYRDLGFGDRSFHERVIQVIDLLLASPEPARPPMLQLPQVKGPYPLERPWEHYEFADPQLQSLASGQKILVRMGLANERRVKAVLRKFRTELATK